MYCNQCGSRIPAGNRFCEKCGAPAPVSGAKAIQPGSSNSGGSRPSGAPSESPGVSSGQKGFFSGPNARARKIALIAAIIVIAGCIGGAAAFFTQNSHSAEYRDKLESAQQYVADGELDKAEQAYLELIDIQPKKETAYLELSDVYIKQKKYDEAIKILKQGEENTGKKEAFSEPIKHVQTQLEGPWKTAYRKLLEENRSLLENYEYPEYGDPRPSVALCDIDGDGIPELFFMLPDRADQYASSSLYIYTYRNGKAVQVDYGHPDFENPTLDSGKPMRDVMAASGTSYVIYTLKSNDHLVIRSSLSDESGDSFTCDYKMVDGPALNGTMWREFWDFNVDSSGNTSESYSYYHDRDSIEESDYTKALTNLEKDMDQLLFCCPSGEYNAFYPDDSAPMTPAAMFCSDAIEDLAVKEAPEEKTESKADDDGIFSELEGKEFVLSSGAGGWANLLTFEKGGRFQGRYYDSNMGETGDDHPNGTTYECIYTGAFKNPRKTGDFEYTLTVDDLTPEKSKGDRIEDGVLIKGSKPYGLENLKPGDTVRLLLPGYPMSSLSEDLAIWLTYVEEGDTLGRHCLVNDTGGEQGPSLFYDTSED